MNALNLDLPNTRDFSIITVTIEGIVDEDDMRMLVAGKAGLQSDPDARAIETARDIEEAEDPTNLKRVRERHHSVARMIANGMTQSLIASICNFTEGYLSILLNNPAMQELIEMYRLQNGSAAQVIGERLKTMGLKAVEKLEEKIDNDSLNPSELTAAAKLGLDRSGHGPSSTQHSVTEHHVLDHAKLQELNRAARQGSKEYIVPVSEVRGALEHKPAEEIDDEAYEDLAEDRAD